MLAHVYSLAFELESGVVIVAPILLVRILLHLPTQTLDSTIPSAPRWPSIL